MSRFLEDVRLGHRCQHERRWEDDCSTCGRRGNGRAYDAMAKRIQELQAALDHEHSDECPRADNNGPCECAFAALLGPRP